MAFYEIRQYVIFDGKMAAWMKLFEEEIIPFQVERGMVISGVFQGETDDSVFIWIRRFEDEAQCKRLYAAVYEDAHWKASISPRIGELMDRSKIQVQRVTPSVLSILQ